MFIHAAKLVATYRVQCKGNNSAGSVESPALLSHIIHQVSPSDGNGGYTFGVFVFLIILVVTCGCCWFILCFISSLAISMKFLPNLLNQNKNYKQVPYHQV